MRSLVNLVVALCVSLHAVFGCCLHHGHPVNAQDCTAETHCGSEHDEHAGRTRASEIARHSEQAWNASSDRDGADGDRPSPSGPAHCSRPDCAGPDCAGPDCLLATQLRIDDSESPEAGSGDYVPSTTFDRPSSSADGPGWTSCEVDRPPAGLRRHLLYQVLLI